VKQELIEYTEIDFLRDLYNNRKTVGPFIYLGIYRNQNVVVKELTTDLKAPAFQTEINTLRKIRHSNIIDLYGICTDKATNPKNLNVREPFYCLVMEYAPHGSLYDLIQASSNPETKLKLPRIVKFLKQIIGALFYLHSSTPPIIHRDLKSGNIVIINEDTIKLIDFGLAKNQNEVSSTHGKGTPRYMAPEQFNSSATDKSDIYSFGLVIWELFNYQIPFPEAINSLHLILLKQNNTYKFEFPLDTPDLLIEIAQSCLNHNPENRPTSLEILSKLTEFEKSIYKKTDSTYTTTSNS